MKDYANKIYGYSQSIYTIDFNKLSLKNFNYVVADLDQTLVPTKTKYPDENVFNLIKELKKYGMKLIIVSNNTTKRVKRFCENLNVKYLSMANKSNSRKISKFLLDLGIDYNKCIFVGDQLRTDLNYVNSLGGKFIITRPLNNVDNIITHLFRKNEEKLKDYLINNNLCGINFNKETSSDI